MSENSEPRTLGLKPSGAEFQGDTLRLKPQGVQEKDALGRARLQPRHKLEAMSALAAEVNAA